MPRKNARPKARKLRQRKSVSEKPRQDRKLSLPRLGPGRNEAAVWAVLTAAALNEEPSGS